MIWRKTIEFLKIWSIWHENMVLVESRMSQRFLFTLRSKMKHGACENTQIIFPSELSFSSSYGFHFVCSCWRSWLWCCFITRHKVGSIFGINFVPPAHSLSRLRWRLLRSGFHITVTMHAFHMSCQSASVRCLVLTVAAVMNTLFNMNAFDVSLEIVVVVKSCMAHGTHNRFCTIFVVLTLNMFPQIPFSSSMVMTAFKRARKRSSKWRISFMGQAVLLNIYSLRSFLVTAKKGAFEGHQLFMNCIYMASKIRAVPSLICALVALKHFLLDVTSNMSSEVTSIVETRCTQWALEVSRFPRCALFHRVGLLES